MQKGLKTRLIIHNILKALKNRNIGFDIVYIEKIKNNNLSNRDKNFIRNVVLNSMRNYLMVNKIIKNYTKKLDLNSDSYFLLLSGITQIVFLGFKDFAVINSSVELTKINSINSSTKLINGVLRNINRNKLELSKIKNNYDNLPRWLLKKISFLSFNEKKILINNIILEPKIHIVLKNKKFKEKIKIENISTTSKSILLKKNIFINDIEGYDDGSWWVQDFSSMTPLYLTKNIKNKSVADLCAAPGGKTFQLINYGAKVNSFDIKKDKIEIMKNNLERLNFKNKCKLFEKNALEIDEKTKYDMVILDAPCSSIGTIRRNPEILFRKQIPNLEKVVINQEKLLSKAKNLLKKRGILIYMVCSFFIEEGEKQIENFIKKNKNFSILKFNSKKNSIFNSLINNKGFFYTIPKTIDKDILIDGFFAAKLIKND